MADQIKEKVVVQDWKFSSFLVSSWYGLRYEVFKLSSQLSNYSYFALIEKIIKRKDSWNIWWFSWGKNGNVFICKMV